MYLCYTSSVTLAWPQGVHEEQGSSFLRPQVSGFKMLLWLPASRPLSLKLFIHHMFRLETVFVVRTGRVLLDCSSGSAEEKSLSLGNLFLIQT